MSDLIDTLSDSFVVAACWAAVSVPAALVLGRILRARNTRETESR